METWRLHTFARSVFSTFLPCIEIGVGLGLRHMSSLPSWPWWMCSQEWRQTTAGRFVPHVGVFENCLGKVAISGSWSSSKKIWRIYEVIPSRFTICLFCCCLMLPSSFSPFGHPWWIVVASYCKIVIVQWLSLAGTVAISRIGKKYGEPWFVPPRFYDSNIM